MRTVIPFNDGWLYTPAQADDRQPDSAFEPVTLPHTNIVLPHHNFDNQEYQFISTYRKRFTLPEPRRGRRVFLDFDGAMIATTVYINGRLANYLRPKDRDAIADAMLEAMDNRERLAEIASKGAERAQFFSWDRVSQRVLSYYERLAFEKGIGSLDSPKVEA